jgi:hypothetical protein
MRLVQQHPGDKRGAPLVLAAPIEKGALMAPLLYQPVGTVYWKVRAAVAE